MARISGLGLAIGVLSAFAGQCHGQQLRADEQARTALAVHLAQANNKGPYTLVRAKFRPGEVPNPWAVRFFDTRGKELAYFVWDHVTWGTAGKGRPDWGSRFALLNHGCGNTAEALEARGRKVAWARANLPKLGAKLAAQDKAADRFSTSVCAALYLVRYSVPPFGKAKLALRAYDRPQGTPKRWVRKGKRVTDRPAARRGELEFRGLPDKLTVVWKGKELFRYTGFEAGETTGACAHADPTQPFAVHVTEGIVTKLLIRGRTKGRRDSGMDWQCAYWLFPEGSYVALEGFALDDTEGYLGGEQKLSVVEGVSKLDQVREPVWEAPWWLHRIGKNGFVATHLFCDTPLTVGYGNNPFTVNPYGGGKEPRVQVADKRMALRWFCSLDDPAVFRLLDSELYYRLHAVYRSPKEYGWRWLAQKREIFLTGKVGSPPKWMTAEARRFVEERLKHVKWEPKVDWLYRQYAVGVGQAAPEAEQALRHVLGAAAGWIDRPYDEEGIASLLVQLMQHQHAGLPRGWEGPLQTVPYLLQPDPAGLKRTLRDSQNQVAATDAYIKNVRTHMKRGGNAVDGSTRDERGSVIGEGWLVNPAYHACKMPSYVRFLEHFELPHPQKEYQDAILRFADFSLEVLGGKPFSLDKLRTSFRSHWPNRFVMIIPLMLHAHTLRPDKRYAQAAKIMFDDLMAMVEGSPHGYWAPWTFRPKRAALFDGVYNPVAYQRGITAFWAEGFLDLIGRQRASAFAAAQARWLVFSAQWTDTLEMDKETALRATDHGGHPNCRNQIPLFLYDDMEFYRGLIGDLVQWAAANPRQQGGHGGAEGSGPYRTLGMAYYGSFTLRWALGIGRQTRWFDRAVKPMPKAKGFTVGLRNALPWAQPSTWLHSHEVGLPGPPRPAVWLRMREPAWRQRAELQVELQDRGIRVRTSARMRVRLYLNALRLSGAPGEKLTLSRRGPGGRLVAVERGVVRGDGFVEWEAEAGQYELR